MDIKTGIIFAGAFIGGAAAGAVTSYFFTKQYCDIHTQTAIEEMKAAHKKELNDIKETKDANKEESEKTEEDFVYSDKPSISEISSIINSNSDYPAKRTKYNTSQSTEDIKKKVEESVKKVAKKKKMVCKTYSEYMELGDDIVANEMEFKYDIEKEMWYDWNNVEYDIPDLPFDPEDVVWDDDSCYLFDEDGHYLYILEKVESVDE